MGQDSDPLGPGLTDSLLETDHVAASFPLDLEALLKSADASGRVEFTRKIAALSGATPATVSAGFPGRRLL